MKYSKNSSFGIKVLAAFIACIILSATMITPVRISSAAEKDVTASMKNNKGIKNICDAANQYCAYIDEDYIKNVKRGNIPLKTFVKYDITGYNLAYEVDYNDKLSYKPRLKEKPFKKLYRNLFGMEANITKDKMGKASIVRSNGKLYCPVSGEWGDSWPVYEITKITEISNGKYRINLSSRFDQEDNDTSIDYNIGNITLVVEKNNKSNFGYILTKLSYVK